MQRKTETKKNEERRRRSGWREVEEAVVQYAAISRRVQEEARKYARRAVVVVVVGNTHGTENRQTADKKCKLQNAMQLIIQKSISTLYEITKLDRPWLIML